MGTVLTFPAARPSARDGIATQVGSATVIILPVVRIERYYDVPSDGLTAGSGASSGRKRRRRASRS